MKENGDHVFGVVDPGTTTGVLIGAIDPRIRGTDALQIGMESGFVETFEVRTARWWEPDLADAVQSRLMELCSMNPEVRSAGWKRCPIVFEDFILRTADKRRTTLDPIRVTSATIAVLRERGWQGKPIYQQPSQAKSVATNKRLKEWNLWVVGSEHERDAMRHAVVYLRGHP